MRESKVFIDCARCGDLFKVEDLSSADRSAVGARIATGHFGKIVAVCGFCRLEQKEKLTARVLELLP